MQLLVGALVGQVSLLESVCQGHTAVSDATPEQNREHSRVMYSHCRHALLRGMLPASWSCPLEGRSSHLCVLGCSGKLGTCFLFFLHLLSEKSPPLEDEAHAVLACLAPPNRPDLSEKFLEARAGNWSVSIIAPAGEGAERSSQKPVPGRQPFCVVTMLCRFSSPPPPAVSNVKN